MIKQKILVPFLIAILIAAMIPACSNAKTKSPALPAAVTDTPVATATNTPNPVDHFAVTGWDSSGMVVSTLPNQVAGVPFNISITAYADALGNTVENGF